ncbi:hypothetical protein ADUPG1_009834 [Aduncisulcus paluster]|uniref:Uncharacterized protein n=1 Tax=Aduncisulcus paluster TaxID=2918883 RepID=A0ABQ5KWY9_9EUKA|nr:hypothetical protein ADUPG1_009834 [Aduncisulcus paluster]
MLSIIKEYPSNPISSQFVSILEVMSLCQDDLTRDSFIAKILPTLVTIHPTNELFGTVFGILSHLCIDHLHLSTYNAGCSAVIPYITIPFLRRIKSYFETADYSLFNIRDCLLLFVNICSVTPSHLIPIYENVAVHILPILFKSIRSSFASEENNPVHIEVIILIMKFVSSLSTVSELRESLSLWCGDMKWCHIHGSFWKKETLNSIYLGNIHPDLSHWVAVLLQIQSTKSHEETKSLLKLHLSSMVTTLTSFSTREMVKEHENEIMIIVDCLSHLLCHRVDKKTIVLPGGGIGEFFNAVIKSLSFVEEVLGELIDDVYLLFSMLYLSRRLILPNKKHLLWTEISHNMTLMLQRGAKTKLPIESCIHILSVLGDVAYSNSYDVCASLIDCISPVFGAWLRTYRSNEIYSGIMQILAFVTHIQPTRKKPSLPDKRLCSRIWPLFLEVAQFVNEESPGIILSSGQLCFIFFYSMCFDHPEHTVGVFDLFSEHLKEWFQTASSSGSTSLYNDWMILLASFSRVPELIPKISPKYDVEMRRCWKICRAKMPFPGLEDYCENILHHAERFLFHSLLQRIPAISLIPSLKIDMIDKLQPTDVKFAKTVHIIGMQCIIPNFFTKLFDTKIFHVAHLYKEGVICKAGVPLLSISNKLKKGRKASESIIHYSDLIQYTPPQHLQVSVAYSDERSMIHSVHHFIENTSACVEALFDAETIQFEGFDQEEWEKRMDIVTKKEEERKSDTPRVSMDSIFRNLGF